MTPRWTWSKRGGRRVAHRLGCSATLGGPPRTLCGHDASPDWNDQAESPDGVARCRECCRIDVRRAEKAADAEMVGGPASKFGEVSWLTLGSVEKTFDDPGVGRACRIAARRFLGRSATPDDQFGVTNDGKRVVGARSGKARVHA